MISRSSLFSITLLLALASARSLPRAGSWMTVVPSGSSWVVQSGTGGCATAKLTDNHKSTGWYVLDLITNSDYSDQDQAYCSGYLEGALTQKQIWDGFRNTVNGTTASMSSAVQQFILNNDQWLRSESAQPSENAEYWNQVALVIAQFDGIYDGYTAYASSNSQISYVDFLFYTLTWEIGDIQSAVGEQNTHSMAEHCSVLIKPSPTTQELYQSHDTWTTFSAMLRVYKHYTHNFNSSAVAARSVSFSSFPGNIPSGDDFYITSANLVVLETTNEVYNTSLYQFTTTKTVPYWIRVVVANRMANDGETWTSVFALYNSGTYNNQWMVIDNKLVNGGTLPYPPNTLWVAEQVPGYVVSNDLTSVLNTQGYWASYNVPYYPFIYKISGYESCDIVNFCSYNNCSRANIFRRDQSSAVDLSSYKRVMRYNQWQTDPLSVKDACASISARCDLNAPWSKNTMNGWNAFGGIDNKVTSNKWSAQRRAEAVCGPTWDSQPPFAWTNEWPYNPHHGHPTVFAFDYTEMKPNQP